MAININDILPVIESVRRAGSGYSGRCPAHEDRTNSLSISEGDNKTVLLHCHAGCDYNQIIAELPNVGRGNGGRKNKEVKETYDYTDENGHLLFQAVRYDPKGFSQRQLNGRGQWINNLRGVSLVLYRLPELRDAELVYICEGEKDVETLRSHGQTATCNPMGAGKWRPEYNASLAGKTVVILPDNDESGCAHAKKVASSLHGTAREILIIDLPDLPEKGDVTDFFEKGRTVDDLIGLVETTAPWTPDPEVAAAHRKSKFVFISIGELIEEPAEEYAYVWDLTLPAGGISILSAKPKVGKSTIARNLAACVARGSPFLGRATMKGVVLYLCLEEKRAEVRRHFERMKVKDEEILIYTGPTPDRPETELRLAVEEHRPILVIIDPLSRVLKGKDFNDYGPMSRAMEPFIDLARETGCHILMAHHDSKGDRTGGDAVLGSTALFGAVDCHLQLKERDKLRTLSSTQRYGEDFPETVVKLNKETGEIVSDGTCKSIAAEKIKNEVLAAMGDGEELTAAEVKKKLNGRSGGDVSSALRELVQDGRLATSGRGVKNDPKVYSKP